MRVQNLEILSLVRRELQREGFIKVLKVHIHPSCASGDMPRLQRIITQLGSEVMPSESAPLPCHSVFLHPGRMPEAERSEVRDSLGMLAVCLGGRSNARRHESQLQRAIIGRCLACQAAQEPGHPMRLVSVRVL